MEAQVLRDGEELWVAISTVICWSAAR